MAEELVHSAAFPADQQRQNFRVSLYAICWTLWREWMEP